MKISKCPIRKNDAILFDPNLDLYMHEGQKYMALNNGAVQSGSVYVLDLLMFGLERYKMESAVMTARLKHGVQSSIYGRTAYACVQKYNYAVAQSYGSVGQANNIMQILTDRSEPTMDIDLRPQ